MVALIPLADDVDRLRRRRGLLNLRLSLRESSLSGNRFTRLTASDGYLPLVNPNPILLVHQPRRLNFNYPFFLVILLARTILLQIVLAILVGRSVFAARAVSSKVHQVLRISVWSPPVLGSSV